MEESEGNWLRHAQKELDSEGKSVEILVSFVDSAE